MEFLTSKFVLFILDIRSMFTWFKMCLLCQSGCDEFIGFWQGFVIKFAYWFFFSFIFGLFPENYNLDLSLFESKLFDMWLLFVVFLWINRSSKGKGILHLLKILPNMAKSFYFNEKHVKKAFLKNALSLVVFTHVAHKMYCLIVLMFVVLETRSFS